MKNKQLRILDPISISENDSKFNSLRIVCTNKQDNIAMTLYECGWERCHNRHFCGPRVRDYYILHFIFGGRGKYSIENNVFELKKNDLFLVPPNIVTYYQANFDNPWKYYWVGFNGTEVNNIIKSLGFGNGVYTMHVEKAARLLKFFRGVFQQSKLRTVAGNYASQSNLYSIFSELVSFREEVPENSIGNEYVAHAIDYMNNNYDNNINIYDVSSYVGLERTYFFKIFKKTMNVSPQEYLISVRMTNAQNLMRETEENLQQIARKVGYENYSNFYRLFVTRYHQTPMQYMQQERNKRKNDTENKTTF